MRKLNSRKSRTRGGVSFSVAPGGRSLPGSPENIFRELHSDLGLDRYFGSLPFSRVNDLLGKHGADPVEWRHP